MHFKILLLMITLLFGASVYAQTGNPVLQKMKIVVFADNSSKVTLTVECARSQSEQTYGLMFRDRLGENDGMLFFFDSDGYRNFWMKNTRIPLSIAYISSRGDIMEMYDMKPLDTSITYPSKYPCRYVLEVNQGWFKKNGIKVGSQVIINNK
jgi:uncharacterized protein